MQFHTQWGVSVVIHITCLIALTFIEIYWVANGHCNSKTKLQDWLEITSIFHNDFGKGKLLNLKVQNGSTSLFTLT
jgi:hypothetical protein